MSLSKISFSLNHHEGREKLRSEASKAGAKSEHLHAKEIVMSHLHGDGALSDLAQRINDLDCQFIRTHQQIDELRSFLHQVANECRQSIARTAITRDQLRNCVFLLLLKQRPSTQQEAAIVVDEAFSGQ